MDDLGNLGNRLIVTIGGGSGQFSLLSGLKNYAISRDNIKSIVTTLDNGGSSGVLITQYGVLPPGDIRNCMIALSDESKVLADLFQYRFKDNLENHNFGNLFLTALTDITGSFEESVNITSKLLRIRGEVIPVSLDPNNLIAILDNGKELHGESLIDTTKDKVISKVYLEKENLANPRAIDAINNSDMIIIGPGDIFTSIIPNLLFGDIRNSIKNSKAKKVLIVNVMTKPGETDDYSVEDIVDKIEEYLESKLDIILVNSKIPNDDILVKYMEKENKYFISVRDKNKIDERFIFADLIDDNDIVRHNPNKLAKQIIKILWS